MRGGGSCFALSGAHTFTSDRAGARLISLDGICFQWGFGVTVFCHFRLAVPAPPSVACREGLLSGVYFDHGHTQRGLSCTFLKTCVLLSLDSGDVSLRQTFNATRDFCIGQHGTSIRVCKFIKEVMRGYGRLGSWLTFL